MRNPSGSTYNKIFSQYEVRKGQLQYYIEATDGINKANVGSKEKPCVIDIKQYTETTSTTINTATVTTTTVYSPPEYEKHIIKNGYVSGTKSGSEMIISAETDTNIRNITLYYKYSDNKTWNSLIMSSNSTDSSYKAVLPASKIREGTLEYYIEASDGINIEKYGSRTEPYTVKVTASSIITQTTTTLYRTTTTTTTTTTAEPPKISNVTIFGAAANSDITVNADITGSESIIASFYYKIGAKDTWHKITMNKLTGTTYNAIIRATNVKEGTLRYYITVSDGLNTAEYRNADSPAFIVVTATTNTTTSSMTITTTTTTAEQPKILNVIISKAKVNEGIKAESDITGNGDISAVLLYKYAEDSEWSRANMTKENGSTYSAYIPAYESRQGTLQYYVEASCGKNTAYFGSAEKPFRIVVMPETTTTKLTTTTTTTTRISPTTTTSSSTTSTTTATRTTSSTSSSSMTTSVSSTSSTSKSASSTTTSTGTMGTTTSTITNPPLITGDTSITISDAEPYKIPLAQNEGVTFVSNNTDVAVVSADGVVTPVGEGVVVIFIIDKNNNVIRLKIAVRHKENAYMLGDVNNDGKINAVDASEVLTYYAMNPQIRTETSTKYRSMRQM
ncbi:hypothetical protein [Ruminococcus flavefaciens]|uniref:hypothetical protein n=1 Tax=Ruminococcus flavefaciens TaxID=1265 RepID=UPI00048ADAEA|nr:hypothetical protein [Ruminococcus flavefaciens]